MIDQWSADRTGWARFSDDMTMRFRLARCLSGRALLVDVDSVYDDRGIGGRVTFLMLNPSTADAFKPDPTIRRCMGFARAWGADVLEVVNIFALRSTNPEALYDLHQYLRGDDPVNDAEILSACSGSTRIVAGWGKHGALGKRGSHVQMLLATHGYDLHHLGLNKDGSPKHPLYLKGGTVPQEWSV